MRRVRLKEIGTFYSGLSGKSKSDFSEGNALLVTYRNIFNNPVLNPAIKDTVVVGKDEKQNEVLWGDILITGSSETPADAGMSSVVLFTPHEKMYLNSFCFGFRLNDMNEVLPSYIGHLLRSTFIRAAISKTAFGVTRFNVNRMRFADIEIPLPPLSIQKEIVSILDSFTSLIDKMKQEVEMRKKQMEYYIDKFYGGDFDDMMRLADIPGNSVVHFSDLGPIIRGKRFVRDDIRTEGQPCIHYGDMYTYYGTKAVTAKTFLERDFPKKMRYAHKGDVVIVGAGENDYDIGVGLVWMGEEPAAVHDACYILKHHQIPMYISYYLRSNIYHQQLKKYVSSGKISSFSAEGLGKVYIPIQPEEKQRQIASILDTFEIYISKLEKMIELRQKQYEYYREKLLTFE
jgi:type I restriction enzyme S subunit